MKQKINLLILLFIFSFTKYAEAVDLPLHLIKMPDGFKINIYARNITNARALAIGDKGTIFVGNRKGGYVHALVDEDKDFKVDRVYKIGENLNSPNGVAFRNGALYVGEIHRVIRYDKIEEKLHNPPDPVVVNDSFPKDGWHGWKVIRFSPEDKLYIPIGAPCNVCVKENPMFASMYRMKPDGTKLEKFASGLRNSVGYDWHPETKELWFTDNGRDMMGDDMPPDELNHAPRKGMHFGFPYCHAEGIRDPKYGKGVNCADFDSVVQPLGPHVAALGMRFYTGDMFPEKYKNQIFIAEHGSWNRSTKVGYRISLVRLHENNPISYETFAEGWLQGDKRWGRPVDVLNMPDGSLLVSDDYSGTVYRITYSAD